MHTRVKLLGDKDADHTQIIGGDTVKLLGEIYPPSPPPRVSAPLMFRVPNTNCAIFFGVLQQLEVVNVTNKFTLLICLFFLKFFTQISK